MKISSFGDSQNIFCNNLLSNFHDKQTLGCFTGVENFVNFDP